MNIFHHDLTPAETEFFRNAKNQERALQTEYYKCLGKAKEADLNIVALTASRDQQLAIVTRNAKLPPGKLKISEDCTQLLIEVMNPSTA